MTTMNGQVDNVVTCVDDVYEHATNAKGMESSEVICHVVTIVAKCFGLHHKFRNILMVVTLPVHSLV